MRKTDIFIKHNKFYLYDEKPITAKSYRARNDIVKNIPVLTIMMQGPIKYDYDFTVETVKIYKQTFPNCPIIISTWDNAKPEVVETLKSLGVDVLLNKDDAPKDFANINRQTVV